MRGGALLGSEGVHNGQALTILFLNTSGSCLDVTCMYDKSYSIIACALKETSNFCLPRRPLIISNEKHGNNKRRPKPKLSHPLTNLCAFQINWVVNMQVNALRRNPNYPPTTIEANTSTVDNDPMLTNVC